MNRGIAFVLLPLLGPAMTAEAQDIRGLTQLAELARERASRQRPRQEAALEPFWVELALDHGLNARVIDSTARKVAALGDGIVPILLEKLAPSEPSPNAINLSFNCAKVLALMEPASFLDPLLDLARGNSTLGRRQALWLLGQTGHPRAAEAIAATFGRLNDRDEIRLALGAMTRLRSPAITSQAVQHLSAPDRELRAAVLAHLDAVGSAKDMPRVLEALGKESDNRLLPDYIRYLTRFARRDERVADALVPLAEGVRLDPEDLLGLCSALATIAPEGHPATLRVMREFLERGETSRLGIQAALTMRELGDKGGEKILFDTLEQRLRKQRDSVDAHADRADASFAFGRHAQAIRDYERAIKLSRAGSRQAVFHLQIARCEAHRGVARGVIEALRESGVGLDTIRREAERDPVFAAVLEKASVRDFLRRLEGR
jgi:tetratricopeptide (TPR) repeat protein